MAMGASSGRNPCGCRRYRSVFEPHYTAFAERGVGGIPGVLSYFL